MRSKIKLTTNKGVIFDWILNLRLNYELWLAGIDDDEERACELVADKLKKWKLTKRHLN